MVHGQQHGQSTDNVPEVAREIRRLLEWLLRISEFSVHQKARSDLTTRCVALKARQLALIRLQYSAPENVQRQLSGRRCWANCDLHGDERQRCCSRWPSAVAHNA